MSFCPACRKEFDAIYRFCPHDGTELVAQAKTGRPALLSDIKERYHLIEELSAGPVERLCLAEDRIDERKVLLQLFKPDFKVRLRSADRLRTEAMLARTVSHPQLAELYDLDVTEDGRYFSVSEAISGVPLRGWLENGSLPPAHAVAVLWQAGLALQQAHGQGLYHGYLTPRSIFVPQPDTRPVAVKIHGGGLARFILAYYLRVIEEATEGNIPPAEVGYVAPELIGGEHEALIGEPSDIYALGVILYESIVGALPFQAETAAAMLDAHLLAEPVPMAVLRPELCLPAALDDLVLRCLAKQPKKRYASVVGLLADLGPIHRYLETTISVDEAPGDSAPYGAASDLGVGQRAAQPSSPIDAGAREPLPRHASVEVADERPPSVPNTAVALDPLTGLSAKDSSDQPSMVPSEVGAPNIRGAVIDSSVEAPTFSPQPVESPGDAAARISKRKLNSSEFEKTAVDSPPKNLQYYSSGAPGAKAPHLSGRNMKFIIAVGSLLLIAVVVFAGTLFWVLNKPKFGRVEVKTTPADAVVYIDGQRVGNSPYLNERLPTGKHTIKVTKEGYQDWVQGFELKPDSALPLESRLQPLSSSHLPPDQQRKVSDLTRKAEMAFKENILIPPPDTYNALYFCDQILALNSQDAFAVEMRNTILGKYKGLAAEAFEQGKWFEAERHYQSLAGLFPNDDTIKQKLTVIAGKIEEIKKDKEKQIADLLSKIKQSLQVGALVPPEPDNALDYVTALLRINPKEAAGRQMRNRIFDQLRQRAENKVADSNFDAAKIDYIAIQRHFPNDKTAAARLAYIQRKVEERDKVVVEARPVDAEQQRRARWQELRQSGANFFRTGDFAASIQALEEAKKLENSDFETYYLLAGAYRERRQYDQSIANYQRALALNPNHGTAHYHLGRLYESHLRDGDRAKTHYGKALQLGTSEAAPDRLRKLIADVDANQRVATLEATPTAVIHKHGVGNCRGHLYLGPAGVRYETSHPGDRFSEPLNNVAFDIKKDGTLEIRVIKGRKYNFQCINAADLLLIRQWIAKR